MTTVVEDRKWRFESDFMIKVIGFSWADSRKGHWRWKWQLSLIIFYMIYIRELTQERQSYLHLLCLYCWLTMVNFTSYLIKFNQMLPHSYWWPIDLHLIVCIDFLFFFLMTIQNKGLIQFCRLTHQWRTSHNGYLQKMHFFFPAFTYKVTIIYSGNNIKLTVDMWKGLYNIYAPLQML